MVISKNSIYASLIIVLKYRSAKYLKYTENKNIAQIKNMDVTTFPNTFPKIISNISDKFLSLYFFVIVFRIRMYIDKKASEIIGTTQLASLLILE